MSASARFLRSVPVLLLLLFAAALAEASLVAAEAALERGDLALAEELVDEAMAATPDSAVRLLEGRILLGRGEFRAAFEQLDAVARERTGDADAWHWLGVAAGNLAANASLFRASRYARACREAFGRAIEIDPAHVAAHRGLIGFHLQAPRLVGGDKAPAEPLAPRPAALDRVEGGLALARVLQATDRDPEARTTLAELTREVPDDPRPWLQLGFDAQGNEDWDAARTAFLAAAEAGDERASHVDARLSALYQIGRTAVFADARHAEGIDALVRYLEAAPRAGLPGHDWAHYRRGLLLDHAGRSDEAREAFATARALTEDAGLKELLARRR